MNPALTFEAIVLKSNPTPVTIINRRRENYIRMEYRNGINGIYCMRNETHRNNCYCLFPVNANNCELTFYSNICIPKDLIIELRYPQDLFDREAPCIMNPLLMFMSFVSKEGLTYPRLACRQPLSYIKKEHIVMFELPFAKMDLTLFNAA